MVTIMNQMRDASGYINSCPLVSDRADFFTVIWWWLRWYNKIEKDRKAALLIHINRPALTPLL